MKLIHKTKFNIIDFTSTIPLRDYALISDDLISEIQSKFYDAGLLDENNEPILIDLNLVSKVNCSEIEGELYSNCDSLEYKDREEEITAYENKIIDNSFRNKNYKVSANLPEFGQLYAGIALMVDKRADILCEFPTSELEDVQVCDIYLDKISANMCALISANSSLFTVLTNPTRDVEVISCSIDNSANVTIE